MKEQFYQIWSYIQFWKFGYIRNLLAEERSVYRAFVFLSDDVPVMFSE